jgi:TP901 family phage tail tape measure protein
MRRDLVIGVDAETGKAETGFGKVTRGASSYERELRKLERQQRKVDQAMDRVGKGMLVAGAAIAAGLAVAVTAAIKWESAWAGVLKTVDGTPEQMAALEQEIRALTAVLPASHEEIAAVAAAAGQLGIQRENVAGFTRVMIDMGESTNLAATEAATALARFMNIMQTAPSDVSRLGSAIVDLGNNSATTEAEIVEMALRIAGAGRTIGLSEAQVLGFSAALSSVGIRAEAGGTAVSRVFLEIDTAVSRGGDTLEVFARTAGMTADQFASAYQQDAGAAIASFVTGLGRVQSSGGDVNAVLRELGLTEIRVSDALRRLSGSGDLLTRSLRTGSEAWDENIALTEEANRRYETTEAKLRIAKNQLNDFAIDMGNTFLPMIGQGAESVAAFVGLLGDLPGPAKAALGILGALSAAILLTGGAALVAVPMLARFRREADFLEASGTRAGVAVGRMRRGMAAIPWGPLGVALAGATVAFGFLAARAAEARAETEAFADTLDRQSGALTRDTRLKALNNLESAGLVEIAERAGIAVTTLVDAALDPQGEAMEEVTRKSAAYLEVLKETGGAIPGLDNDVDALNRGLEEQSERVAGSRDVWRRQQEILAESGQEERGLAGDVDFATDAIEEQVDVVDELIKSLDEMVSAVFAARDAERGYEAALDDAREAIERNGATLDTNTEAGRDNEKMLDELAAAGLRDAAATLKDADAKGDLAAGHKEATEKMEDARSEFIEVAREMGLSKDAAKELADELGLIPGNYVAQIAADTSGAWRQVGEFLARVNNLTGEVHIVGTGFAGRFQHGGEVRGPAGIDRVPLMGTAGEIMIRRDVAQDNRAALLALNATGRWPVSGGGGGSVAMAGGASTGETHVHLTAYTDRFSLRQVLDDLSLRGAS